ncbi:arylamine N-acetyltransferase family protein [Thermocoleostomius sinensis]|uniref:Arylamine N-acetyltransferase n=1 Tax=Thermocoleostomius sinensis A174 TaxID=2016057 RepID=A0A9E8ZAU2_9CYAN|nr:arylamine N-acetyltransferase [Thermocoleostomius sinensis]WAL59784.1 arylamine N-acetyltransferase [Thermocoleostomius sinensis A174]
MLSIHQLDAYLERIQYHGSLGHSEETLCQLHQAQAQHIPFENLDIFLGQDIHLDPDRLFNKLINRKRGGYCYELNGLFLLVLQHLGFHIIPMAARVFMPNGSLRQKSHQMAIVELRGQSWLVDVGFGGNGLVQPIVTEVNREWDQTIDTFRLQSDENLGLILQHQLNDEWRSLYAFIPEKQYPADYRMMNFFASRSPDSLFTRKRLCIIPTSESRIILNNHVLKIRGVRHSIVTQLTTADSYDQALKQYFGIALSPEVSWHLYSPIPTPLSSEA